MEYNLTLTRTSANRTYTWGLLSCDGKPQFGVVTLEMRLPQTGGHTMLLPPGRYRIGIGDCYVMYKGEPMLLPWLGFSQKVPLMPRAAFSNTTPIVVRGSIVVCKRRTDDFTPDGMDDATFELSKLAYQLRKAGMSQGWLTVVEEREKMQMSEMSVFDWQREKAYEQEMLERQQREDFLKCFEDDE